MARLAKVEMRKALDTRAGRWLVIGILGLVVVIEVIYAFAANDGDKNLQDFIQIPGAVLGYFLPIVVIMLVTSEASQRNGLVTFTLEPRRSRIVVAKFLAGIGLAARRDGARLGPGRARNAVRHRHRERPDVVPRRQPGVQRLLLSNLIGIFVGFAIAMLIMNTAGAIVAYFAYSLILPTAVGILGRLSDTFEDIAPWIEFNTAQTPLISRATTRRRRGVGADRHLGHDLADHPAGAGIWRLMRIEFK